MTRDLTTEDVELIHTSRIFSNKGVSIGTVLAGPTSLYSSAVQPAARGPHAARRLISCGPPLLAKIVRNNIMFKKSCKRQNLPRHLTISTQIKLFKFIKIYYTQPTSKRKCNVMQSNNYI